jgi:MFS family permease
MQPPRGEPERSQRISILEGSLAQVHITITGGSLVTAYALMLGAGDFQLGLVSAFTALSTMGAILGAQWVGHLGRRKPLSVICSAGGRGLWALLCLIPFLPIPLGAQLAMMLGVVFVGNSLVNLSGTGWLSWMTDLVPLERRGRYFGRRNMVLGAVAMMTSFGAGHVLDRYVAREMRAQGLAVIFGFAAATALAAGAVLTRQWEPPLLGEQSRPLIETIRRPFTNRRFARLLTFAILWAMATGISSPFFGAHMIKNLHMSFSLIAVYSILAGILNLVSLPVWGKVIDRVGNRPVLAICLLGVFFLPLLWLFATRTNLWPIWLDAALTGVFWPGFSLASFNLVLATAPEENRTAYLGVQTMVVGVATFLASLLGGVVADALGGIRVHAMGLTLINFHLVFIASAVFRVALLPLALRLRETHAQTVGALLGLVGDQASQRLAQGWQMGVSVVRKISGNG